MLEIHTLYIFIDWRGEGRDPSARGISRKGEVRDNSGLQLNHLFNNEGSCLSHTHNTA